MIHRRLSALGFALALCALCTGAPRDLAADVITYTAEIPFQQFMFYGTPEQTKSLGTFGPNYLENGVGSPIAIPVDRVITQAKLSGTWGEVQSVDPNGTPIAVVPPAWTRILADGVVLAEHVGGTSPLPDTWEYTLTGSLDHLRTQSVAMSLRIASVGQELRGIGVGPTRIEITTVPEPASLVLWSAVGVTCAGALYLRRRRRTLA